jgi:glutathione S-transferase
MIKLYDYELSGNCYKVRLLLGALWLPFERIELDFYPGCEHKSPWFLAINPLGQLPVIDDRGFILREAQAILVYLAARYDATGLWCPRDDAAALARILMWLGFAESLSASAGAARLHDTMFYDLDVGKSRAAAHGLFRVLDEHLWFAEQQGEQWLCSSGHPTIADIACFPYVRLSEEGGISRLPYPAIRRWTDRVEGIAGFTPMPGILNASEPTSTTRTSP